MKKRHAQIKKEGGDKELSRVEEGERMKDKTGEWAEK